MTVDIAGFIADLKEHATEHGFHVHDERHFVETYSLRQSWEVDVHPEAGCGGPIDLHLALDVDPKVVLGLRERLEVHVHGACIGAGIELPAYAGKLKARPDAFFQLPEVSMGLIPGAGGTVSILPRIGRHRLAFMALTSARIDAETALDWGLVDEIMD